MFTEDCNVHIELISQPVPTFDFSHLLPLRTRIYFTWIKYQMHDVHEFQSAQNSKERTRVGPVVFSFLFFFSSRAFDYSKGGGREINTIRISFFLRLIKRSQLPVIFKRNSPLQAWITYVYAIHFHWRNK